MFCGDCLFMRYGENVDEANADPEWTCPHCRDKLLCNCSQHRTRRGWPPTGSLYRKAIALGALSLGSIVHTACPDGGLPDDCLHAASGPPTGGMHLAGVVPSGKLIF